MKNLGATERGVVRDFQQHVNFENIGAHVFNNMKENEKFVSTGSFLKAKNTFVKLYDGIFILLCMCEWNGEKVTHKDLCAHIVNHTIYYTQ